MENPSTWDEVTRVIHAAITRHAEKLAVGVIGLSLERTIRDALDGALLTPEEYQRKLTEAVSAAQARLEEAQWWATELCHYNYGYITEAGSDRLAALQQAMEKVKEEGR